MSFPSDIPIAVKAGSGASSRTKEHEGDVGSDEELSKYYQARSSNLDTDLHENNSLSGFSSDSSVLLDAPTTVTGSPHSCTDVGFLVL